MNFSGKTVTIIGAARSGQAAARLITRLEGRVKISESDNGKNIPEDFQRWMKENHVAAEFNGHIQSFIQASDLVVLSPGVRIDALPVAWARAKGIPVWGEIELGYRFCSKPIIAITGSNGKTTVSNLITQNLQAAGYRVRLCGNVGYPFTAYVLDLDAVDFVVVEISSFQLETIEQFKPRVAVLLNLSQNHLDRHKDMEEYFAAKMRIFLNQDRHDHAVLNAADAWGQRATKAVRSQVVFFNDSQQTSRETIKNPNYLAAAAAVEVLGVSRDVCRQVFNDFRGVEHRLERVRTIRGVEFINDSKATTAEAGRWAVESLDKPIVMICGGRDKNIDFTVLRDVIKQKVKTMIVIGEAREKLKTVFTPVIPVEESRSLEEAVRQAQRRAREGECVLLSPMCASFDMFKNFEERGQVFKDIVQKLD